MVMIIHPICDLYDQYLGKWYWKDITIRFHQKNSLERIYMNYPPPLKLQTAKYLGADRTDRQRIARRAERWIDKINNLDPLERQYLIEKLLEYYAKH